MQSDGQQRQEGILREEHRLLEEKAANQICDSEKFAFVRKRRFEEAEELVGALRGGGEGGELASQEAWMASETNLGIDQETKEIVMR